MELFSKKNTNPEADPKTGQFVDPEMGAFFLKFLRILMQSFAGFPACLLLRMLYSYMPAD